MDESHKALSNSDPDINSVISDKPIVLNIHDIDQIYWISDVSIRGDGAVCTWEVDL